MTRAALALAVLALAGCTSSPEVVKGTAVDHGKALFSSSDTSPSPINAFSCATCHVAESADAKGKILAGAPLAGVVERPTFWGGQENDLLRSIDNCLFYFMGASERWTAEDEDAKAMYAYLSSLPKEITTAVPFTVVPSVADLDPGDEKAGADVYARACQNCHGALHTGEGRLTARASLLPDAPLAEHEKDGFSIDEQRQIFVEKIRHGGFRGYGGAMPPFSEETLSDEQVASLLSYLDLYK
jgi:thiosulfate dehydrogenase